MTSSFLLLFSQATTKSGQTNHPRSPGAVSPGEIPWKTASAGSRSSEQGHNPAPRRSLFVLLCALSPCPVAASARLPGPRHARGQVITWAVLALLGLDGLVVHVHIVVDGGHVLVAQQFLQAEGVIAQHQVADGERVAQDVRALFGWSSTWMSSRCLRSKSERRRPHSSETRMPVS